MFIGMVLRASERNCRDLIPSEFVVLLYYWEPM